MKKLLKFMLMPMLVGTPAMSVVACSNNDTQVAPDQVLNIAAGRMNSGTFKMMGNPKDPNDVDRLGLKTLPANGLEYNKLSDENKNVITQHFKRLVTTGSGSTAGDWQYPSVDVSITEIVSKNFITRYKGNVQSKITVNANLSYSGLTTHKQITVVVVNDLTNSIIKAQYIAAEVKTQLNSTTQTPIDLDTLPMNGIKGNSLSKELVLQKIQGSLRQAWVNPQPTNITDKSWFIDVLGNVQITASFNSATATDSFYNLGTPVVSTDKAFINGELSNLAISITYTSPLDATSGAYSFSTADLTTAGGKIKVQQSTDTAMRNQLANALPKDSITLNKAELPSAPTPSQTWNDFAPSGSAVDTAVKNFIFTGQFTAGGTDGIFSVYPKDMAGFDTPWNADILTITGTTPFQPSGAVTNNIGKFVVNFELKYTIKTGVNVDISVSAEITTNYN